MKLGKGLKYSKEHEWVRIEGDKVYVGITDFAQNALGDIVFVELPETDLELEAGDILGVVESVKAASDIYTPVSGTVIEVNEELNDSPETINESPYEAWIAVIELKDILQLDDLMDEHEYEDFCSKEE
ncbi:MAG TPA: glycine cleavage system protein GcvH [Clostridiaceae bacterium]|jgi:glycine cleavage system H protein|nr:glycine cleavage system protein GcvH [Clostridiaceae bacterium]